jgi:AcrR family transcriptional regulator
MTAVRSAPARRSQEERSAATRERLLDATVECLVELGYGKTTTTEIVRRAGVSRGAQVHHFPTKAELVQQAVAHLAQRQGEEFLAAFSKIRAKKDDVSQAIDLLWESYTGPLFVAGLELIVSARTDPTLRPAVEALLQELGGGMLKLSDEVLGPQAAGGVATDAVDLTIHLMQGMALARLLNGPRDREARLLATWKDAVRPLFESAR